MRRVAMGVAATAALVGCGSAGDQRPAVRRAAAATLRSFGLRGRVEGLTVHGSTARARVRVHFSTFGIDRTVPVALHRDHGRWHFVPSGHPEITIIR